MINDRLTRKVVLARFACQMVLIALHTRHERSSEPRVDTTKSGSGGTRPGVIAPASVLTRRLSFSKCLFRPALSGRGHLGHSVGRRAGRRHAISSISVWTGG